jgi:hypothetical protein
LASRAATARLAAWMAAARTVGSSARAGADATWWVTGTPCIGDGVSPNLGDVKQRKKLSTTIGPGNYAYLHSMVKAGRAESVGDAVDKAVELARRLDNRATLERQTAAYFKGLPSKATAEETDLEAALSAASQEMDFDQP